MNTTAEPQATPGIAGRYFVLERRERFAKLTARVTVFRLVDGMSTYIVTLGSRDLLSPRRIARKLRLSGAQANQLADRIFLEMQHWSVSGFFTSPVAGDPTIRIAGEQIAVGHVIVRLQDGGQL